MDADDTSARLRALAARFEALAVHAQRLADENRSLRQQQEQLSGERSQLLAKNEQARTRVEAMIARLATDRVLAVEDADDDRLAGAAAHARLTCSARAT